MASEQNPRNPTASEYESKIFGKWFPGTTTIPKTLQKRSAEFLNIGKRNFSSVSDFSFPKLRNPSQDKSLEVHTHTHWLATRCPTRRGRTIVCVDASGLVLGTIEIQEPKSGYHYGGCALTETTFMTNPVEPWKTGLLTPHTFFTPCALLQLLDLAYDAEQSLTTNIMVQKTSAGHRQHEEIVRLTQTFQDLGTERAQPADSAARRANGDIDADELNAQHLLQDATTAEVRRAGELFWLLLHV